MNAVEPVVDILLATYNGADFLPEQLESIEAQTYRNWRLLVRDDGSTDGTLDIVRAFRARHAGRVEIVEDEEQRLGPRGNFDRLLSRSGAPYFMFCDQDDVWLPNKTEVLLKAALAAEAKAGVDCPVLVHSNLAVVDRELHPLAKSFWRYQKIDPRRSRWNHLLVQNVVTGCASIGNAALRDAIQPIPTQAVMHDWWAALVTALVGRIDWIDDVTVLYRQHGGNDTGAKHWGVRFIIRSIPELFRRDRLRVAIKAYSRQASLLCSRFGERLDPACRAGLCAFADLPGKGMAERRLTLFQYGIWKTGWIRNLALLVRI